MFFAWLDQLDAQSFPFASPSAPQLAQGAFAPELVYTVSDIKQVVAHAADRGISVLIEVDVPGHAASWRVGRPDLMAQCMEKVLK